MDFKQQIADFKKITEGAGVGNVDALTKSVAQLVASFAALSQISKSIDKQGLATLKDYYKQLANVQKEYNESLNKNKSESSKSGLAGQRKKLNDMEDKAVANLKISREEAERYTRQQKALLNTIEQQNLKGKEKTDILRQVNVLQINANKELAKEISLREKANKEASKPFVEKQEPKAKSSIRGINALSIDKLGNTLKESYGITERDLSKYIGKQKELLKIANDTEKSDEERYETLVKIDLLNKQAVQDAKAYKDGLREQGKLIAKRQADAEKRKMNESDASKLINDQLKSMSKMQISTTALADLRQKIATGTLNETSALKEQEIIQKRKYKLAKEQVVRPDKYEKENLRIVNKLDALSDKLQAKYMMTEKQAESMIAKQRKLVEVMKEETTTDEERVKLAREIRKLNITTLETVKDLNKEKNKNIKDAEKQVKLKEKELINSKKLTADERENANQLRKINDLEAKMATHPAGRIKLVQKNIIELKKLHAQLVLIKNDEHKRLEIINKIHSLTNATKTAANQGTIKTDFMQNLSPQKLLSRASFVMTARAAYVAMDMVNKVFRESFNLSIQIQEELSKTFVIMKNATKEIREQFSEETLRVMAKYNLELKDVTDSLYQIVSAQIPEGNVLLVLNESAKLAKANFADIKQTADLLTTIMNTYGNAQSGSGSISDMLSETVRLGKTTLPELSKELGRIIPIANNAGIELSELLAILSTMTRNGVKTNLAVTSLRQLIATLTTPTKQAKKILNEYGLEFGAVNIKQKGLIETMKDYSVLLTDEQFEIAKTRTGRVALLSLLGNINDAYSDQNSILNSVGVTEKMVNERTQTLSSKLDTLWKGLVSNMKLFADGFLSTAESLVDGLSLMKNNIDDFYSYIDRKSGVTGMNLIFESQLGSPIASSMTDEYLKKYKESYEKLQKEINSKFFVEEERPVGYKSGDQYSYKDIFGLFEERKGKASRMEQFKSIKDSMTKDKQDLFMILSNMEKNNKAYLDVNKELERRNKLTNDRDETMDDMFATLSNLSKMELETVDDYEYAIKEHDKTINGLIGFVDKYNELLKSGRFNLDDRDLSNVEKGLKRFSKDDVAIIQAQIDRLLKIRKKLEDGMKNLIGNDDGKKISIDMSKISFEFTGIPSRLNSTLKQYALSLRNNAPDEIREGLLNALFLNADTQEERQYIQDRIEKLIEIYEEELSNANIKPTKSISFGGAMMSQLGWNPVEQKEGQSKEDFENEQKMWAAGEFVTQTQNLATTFTELWQQAYQRDLENFIEANNNKRDAEIESVNSEIMTAEHRANEINAINNKYDKKQEKEEQKIAKKQAKLNKKMAIIRATTDFATGSMNIWSHHSWNPIVLAGLQALLTTAFGANLALINKQKFAKGGILQGESHANGGIPLFGNNGSYFGEAEGGEAIFSKRATMGNEHILMAQNKYLSRGGSFESFVDTYMKGNMNNFRMNSVPKGRYASGGITQNVGGLQNLLDKLNNMAIISTEGIDDRQIYRMWKKGKMSDRSV